MESFDWNPLKDDRLKKTRGLGFEEILKARLIDIRNHPTCSEQEIMLFEREGYIWVVPFVRMGEISFLKTIYPNRKYTKMFERGEL